MHAEDMDSPHSRAAQEYWDDSYRSLQFGRPGSADPLREWLLEHVPEGSGTCFEVGCFPGRYLSVLGDLGYELNGVDLTPRVENDLPAWLESCGYRVGTFRRQDFLGSPVAREFDVVASFGFIEHFDDWASVLRRHVPLVALGGLLVIESPNFAGDLQRELREALDAENLARHNLSAMHPDQWRDVLAAAGVTTLWTGYIGRFEFWTETQSFTAEQQELLAQTMRRTRSLREEGVNASMSPYCGLIGRRDR